MTLVVAYVVTACAIGLLFARSIADSDAAERDRLGPGNYNPASSVALGFIALCGALTAPVVVIVAVVTLLMRLVGDQIKRSTSGGGESER